LNTNNDSAKSGLATLGHRLAILGFLLFSIFAPHSIAGAEIALAIAAVGWLLRIVVRKTTGITRSRLDLPIWLLFLWTIASAVFSEEPEISVGKLQSTLVFLVFYLTQAIVRRRSAVVLVVVMIMSGLAGSLYSVVDLLRGRGVVVESIAPTSPLRTLQINPGDTVWRVAKVRVNSVSDLDRVIKGAQPGKLLVVSVISRGEHVEREGLQVTPELRALPSPSGITGSQRNHRFRASGWTSHYVTFAEILQILTQLALGLAFANFQNHGANRRFQLAAAAAVILGIGISLTAMRTVLIAMAIGAAVVAIRAAGGRGRVLVTAAIVAVLAFGVLIVWQTRASEALRLNDDSSNLRIAVAKAGLERIPRNPIFGHGMDSLNKHWQEWGFPALLHLHSTPMQIAFDRGLPALLFWLWIIFLFGRMAHRGELLSRDSGDTNAHGILLGATGAITGFFASSLVNYNFGDGEVALVFWWLMGVVLVMTRERASERSAGVLARLPPKVSLSNVRGP
jgi:hypothetical protein